jgi:hypothetical protein
MYKTLTGIIAGRISSHLEEHNLLAAEQTGNHSGSRVCKDKLLISKAIFEDSKKRKKNLSIAWIDYQKAFDSVPHIWIEKSIELLGLNNKIINFFKSSMEKWSTRLQLKTNQELWQSRLIKINRGIFQGIPITYELNRHNCGYKIHGTEMKISHLLYVDDLKLIGRSEEELTNVIQILKTLSSDIKMKFGWEKCARICLKNGKVYRTQHMGNTMETEIKALDIMKACC